jgi:glycine cleavage system H protein
MNIPKELKYTQDHEWAKVAGSTARVGITEFAVEQLGDITLVELPEIGKAIKAGEAIGVIESVKAVSDLFAPLTGKVKAVNSELEDAPEKVNEDPYGGGWMLEIEIGNSSEVAGLFDADGYKAHLDSLED